MSGYCDFNPRLFKPFTSMKTKIVPGMADDWEMVPSSYVKIGGFGLHSKKLNQTVQDIDLMRFLRFCKEQNLVIEALKLKGNFIVGNDRSVYTEGMWQTWKDKFDTRTETIIDKKDYQVGHHYKTPCGAEYVYLGCKYVSNIKNKHEGDYTKISNIVKRYYVIGVDKIKQKIKSLDAYSGVSELKQKFTKDFGEVITPERAAEYMEWYLGVSPAITCWEDEKPGKDVEYELQEMFMPRHSLTYHNQALIVQRGGKLYGNSYSNSLGISISYYGPEIPAPTAPEKNQWGGENYDYRDQKHAYDKSQTTKDGGWFYNSYYCSIEFNKDSMKQKSAGWGRSNHDGEYELEKMFRIGIKK